MQTKDNRVNSVSQGEPSEISLELIDLVFLKLAKQMEDGYGPVDLNLAVYFALLETEERLHGKLPEFENSELERTATLVSQISAKQ